MHPIRPTANVLWNLAKSVSYYHSLKYSHSFSIPIIYWCALNLPSRQQCGISLNPTSSCVNHSRQFLQSSRGGFIFGILFFFAIILSVIFIRLPGGRRRCCRGYLVRLARGLVVLAVSPAKTIKNGIPKARFRTVQRAFGNLNDRCRVGKSVLLHIGLFNGFNNRSRTPQTAFLCIFRGRLFILCVNDRPVYVPTWQIRFGYWLDVNFGRPRVE